MRAGDFSIPSAYANEIQLIAPGCTWDVVRFADTDCTRVTLGWKGWRNQATLTYESLMRAAYPPEHIIGQTLTRLAREMVSDVGSSPESRTDKDTLRMYKETVKRLSFELEMARGAPSGVTVVRTEEVRRLALEQAAEYVMDFGIPQSGGDLARLCEEIKRLPVHKVMEAQS